MSDLGIAACAVKNRANASRLITASNRGKIILDISVSHGSQSRQLWILTKTPYKEQIGRNRNFERYWLNYCYYASIILIKFHFATWFLFTCTSHVLTISAFIFIELLTLRPTCYNSLVYKLSPVCTTLREYWRRWVYEVIFSLFHQTATNVKRQISNRLIANCNTFDYSLSTCYCVLIKTSTKMALWTHITSTLSEIHNLSPGKGRAYFITVFIKTQNIDIHKKTIFTCFWKNNYCISAIAYARSVPIKILAIY